MSSLFIKDNGDSVEAVVWNKEERKYECVGQIWVGCTQNICVGMNECVQQDDFEEFIELYQKKKAEWTGQGKEVEDEN